MIIITSILLMNLKNLNIERIYQILLIVLALSLSLPERILPLVMILLAPLSLYLRFKHKLNYFKNKDSWFYVLIFLLYVLGLLWCDQTKEGLKIIEKNLSFIVMPLVIIPQLLPHKKKILSAFIISFIIIALYTLVATLINILFFESELRWYFQEIDKFGFHPTYMGLYCLLAIVMITREKLFENNKKLNWILLSFLILFLFFLASRIAILALVFLLILRLITSWKKEYFIGLISIFVIGVGLFFASDDFNYKTKQLLDFKGLTYYDNNNYGSVSVRVAKIKASLKVWSQNPWLGSGTGCLKEDLVTAYRSKSIECWPCSRQQYNPHNQYLSFLAGHGVVGLVLFSALLLFLVYRGIRSKNNILLECLLLFMIVFLTESVLHRQRGLTAFLFFMILFYGIHNQRKELNR